MNARLHFSRVEMKYVLPNSIRDQLERELESFVELDPFVAEQPGQKYTVRSLYYDDLAMSRYYEKIDGMMFREKFRVRTYGTSEQEPEATFLEIKGRHNALVFKHRVQLQDAAAESAPEDGDNSDLMAVQALHALDEQTRQVLLRLPEGEMRTRFVGDLLRRGDRPVMLIDYRRRPYVSKYDPAFRLTFDDSLSCCATKHLYPSRREGGRQILLGQTVLEIKFEHNVPMWFHRAIRGFELRRISISKYCAGVEAYDLTPKLE